MYCLAVALPRRWSSTTFRPERRTICSAPRRSPEPWLHQFGMSDKLGLVSFEGPRTPLFLPIPVQTAKEYSEDSARLIDAEVKRILTEAHEK